MILLLIILHSALTASLAQSVTKTGMSFLPISTIMAFGLALSINFEQI